MLSTKLKKEVLIEHLMSTNYPFKVVNDVIGTIDSYDQKIIEFEKKRKKTKQR